MLALIGVALALRLWGSAWGLPHLYHPEENRTVGWALALGRDDVARDDPGPASLHAAAMFLVHETYVAAGRLWRGFASRADFLAASDLDASAFYLVGRWLSAVLGALTVGLTYLAGRGLYNRRVGLLGALFLTVNYLHVKDSHYATPEVAMTFLVMAAFVFAGAAAVEPRPRNYAVAGALTALAVAVKFPALLAMVPLGVAHLLAVKRYPERVGRAAVRAGAAGLLLPIALLVMTPRTILDWRSILAELQHQPGQVARPLGLLERLTPLLVDNLVLALGIGLYLAALAGLLLCCVHRRPSDLVLIAFPLAFFALLFVTGGLHSRHLIPTLPFLCLLAAVFVAHTAATAFGRLPRAYRPLTAGLILIVVFQPAGESLALDLALTEPDTRTRAGRWIERNIPAGARVAITEYGPPLLRVGEGAPATRADDDGRPRYTVFELRPVPYAWRRRVATGEATGPGQIPTEFAYFFAPERFLISNDIDYVVLSSSMSVGKLRRVLLEGAQFVRSVRGSSASAFGGRLPFFALHNPTLEIYRVR